MPTSLRVFSALAAATPQTPPLRNSGISLVPVRPVTDRQMLRWGSGSNKSQKCTTGPPCLATGMAQTLRVPDTLTPPPKGCPLLLEHLLNPSLRAGAVPLRWKHLHATSARPRAGGGELVSQSISRRAGANHQPFTVPWGVARDKPFPSPLCFSPRLRPMMGGAADNR